MSIEKIILGKTLKELRKMAAKYKISGRSKMKESELQQALWNHLYGGDFLPSNREQMVDFLMLHPNKLVRELQEMWMCYGGKLIINSLQILTQSLLSTVTEESEEERKKYDIGSAALKDSFDATIAAINHHLSVCNLELEAIEYKYWAEAHLENHKGEVLFLVNPECVKMPNDGKISVRLYFSESGKTLPVGTFGWICLESGQKELVQQIIRMYWESLEQESYLISANDLILLRQRLDLVSKFPQGEKE
ncbi:MAG TPA: Rho termination factor N-terminal domain-containing protein [Nostocaceae cyanobacterium]|nr:Rho termination factor N-terminal domain-containing protein [Nostocaceae cyanobacterium]